MVTKSSYKKVKRVLSKAFLAQEKKQGFMLFEAIVVLGFLSLAVASVAVFSAAIVQGYGQAERQLEALLCAENVCAENVAGVSRPQQVSPFTTTVTYMNMPHVLPCSLPGKVVQVTVAWREQQQEKKVTVLRIVPDNKG